MTNLSDRINQAISKYAIKINSHVDLPFDLVEWAAGWKIEFVQEGSEVVASFDYLEDYQKLVVARWVLYLCKDEFAEPNPDLIKMRQMEKEQESGRVLYWPDEKDHHIHIGMIIKTPQTIGEALLDAIGKTCMTYKELDDYFVCLICTPKLEKTIKDNIDVFKRLSNK